MARWGNKKVYEVTFADGYTKIFETAANPPRFLYDGTYPKEHGRAVSIQRRPEEILHKPETKKESFLSGPVLLPDGGSLLDEMKKEEILNKVKEVSETEYIDPTKDDEFIKLVKQASEQCYYLVDHLDTIEKLYNSHDAFYDEQLFLACAYRVLRAEIEINGTVVKIVENLGGEA